MTVSGTANVGIHWKYWSTRLNNCYDCSLLNQDGSRWGMTKTLSFAGSGEMDNGWTVSIATTLADAASSAVSVNS